MTGPSRRQLRRWRRPSARSSPAPPRDYVDHLAFAQARGTLDTLLATLRPTAA